MRDINQSADCGVAIHYQIRAAGYDSRPALPAFQQAHSFANAGRAMEILNLFKHGTLTARRSPLV
jgi:hypothetical protein